MATSPQPESWKQEQSSTYFVQDRSNQDELARVTIQDELVTASMGGVLPEQPDPTTFHSVLDVACGTGSWLLEMARTYLTMTRLLGVDISGTMIAYATQQAQERHLSDRVEFKEMDALIRLNVPDASFDLVNMRFGGSFMRTWDWPKLLREFLRVVHYEGTVRLTETTIMAQTPSASLTCLLGLLTQAFYQSGHFFEQGGDGIVQELVPLLHRAGLKGVTSHTYAISYAPGTPELKHFTEDMMHVFRTARPFIAKWVRLRADYEAIYQQAVQEMQQPNFYANTRFVTAWGIR